MGVVEGDHATREMVVRTLAARAWDTMAFPALRPALEAFAKTPPDLIVLDIDLPEGFPLNVIGALSTESGTPVPVIVVSESDDEQDFLRGFAAGAVDYMAKPFRPAELVARCRAHFARSTAPVLGTGAWKLPSSNGLAFGRYKLLGELGRGGFGTVYLAEDAEDYGARVALKVPSSREGLDREARARFVRESHALARVMHQNVVRVRNVGFEGDVVFLAMEHVDGEPLTLRVSRDGPLSEGEARTIARGLLGALSALELAKIVHRDVKPGNVILKGGSTANPVLIDFGLAKPVSDRDLTSHEDLLGTLHYMAPEVVRGRAPDARSDLYSLGITLWFALWGEEPFADVEGYDLLVTVTHGPVPDLPVAVSPAFRELVSSLCSTDPAWRPHSAVEALAALDEVIRSPASVDKAPKTATRRRLKHKSTTKMVDPGFGDAVEEE